MKFGVPVTVTFVPEQALAVTTLERQLVTMHLSRQETNKMNCAWITMQ